MGYVSFKIHLCFVSLLCYIYEHFCHFYATVLFFDSLLSLYYPIIIFCHFYVTFLWIYVTFMSHFWNCGTNIVTEYQKINFNILTDLSTKLYLFSGHSRLLAFSIDWFFFVEPQQSQTDNITSLDPGRFIIAYSNWLPLPQRKWHMRKPVLMYHNIRSEK